MDSAGAIIFAISIALFFLFLIGCCIYGCSISNPSKKNVNRRLQQTHYRRNVPPQKTGYQTSSAVPRPPTSSYQPPPSFQQPSSVNQIHPYSPSSLSAANAHPQQQIGDGPYPPPMLPAMPSVRRQPPYGPYPTQQMPPPMMQAVNPSYGAYPYPPPMHPTSAPYGPMPSAPYQNQNPQYMMSPAAGRGDGAGWNPQAFQPQAQPPILVGSIYGSPSPYGMPPQQSALPGTTSQRSGLAKINMTPAVVHPAPPSSRHARSARSLSSKRDSNNNKNSGKGSGSNSASTRTGSDSQRTSSSSRSEADRRNQQRRQSAADRRKK